jgi:hypothetical protein
MKKIIVFLLILLNIVNVSCRSSDIIEANRLKVFVPEEIIIDNYNDIYPDLAEGFNILRSMGQNVPLFNDFMVNQLSVMDEGEALGLAQDSIIAGMKDSFCLIFKNMIKNNENIDQQMVHAVFGYVMHLRDDFMQGPIREWVNNYGYSRTRGHTLLIEACKKNQTNNLRILLDFGADSNIAVEGTGLTALHFTAMKNTGACTRILVDAGANLNQLDSSGNTPLMKALLYGSLDVAEILLGAGADRTGADQAAQLVGQGEWFAEHS